MVHEALRACRIVKSFRDELSTRTSADKFADEKGRGYGGGTYAGAGFLSGQIFRTLEIMGRAVGMPQPSSCSRAPGRVAGGRGLQPRTGDSFYDNHVILFNTQLKSIVEGERTVTKGYRRDRRIMEVETTETRWSR